MLWFVGESVSREQRREVKIAAKKERMGIKSKPGYKGVITESMEFVTSVTMRGKAKIETKKTSK